MFDFKKVPIGSFHEDDRAQRMLDVFNVVEGVSTQINISYVNSTKHVVAWHKHDKQTDYWFCVKGSIKVGLAIPTENGQYEVKWEYLSDKNPRVLKIPPKIYHGYKALQDESIMLYYLTHKYDSSDEEKQLPGYFGEEWLTKSK